MSSGQTLVVTAREVLAEGVISLTLADPGGGRLPPWEPGAHVDLLLGDFVRQYSLCGPPDDQHTWRLAVLLEAGGRGGSAAAHQMLKAGDRVAVRGPRNHFALRQAERYIFIAGGIGVTPLLPMIAVAAASGASWQLFYGGRRRASMAFLDELEGYGERVVLWPQDERGLLPLGEILGTAADGVLVYCCGPEGLLAAVEQRCAAWPPGTLRVERFSPKPQPESGPGGDAAFEVVCQRSGLTVTVPPGKSILETLDEQGLTVISSCQEGVCGTCETRVLEGIPDHRDSLLTDEEREANDYMMVCVSRAKSDRLVLDL